VSGVGLRLLRDDSTQGLLQLPLDDAEGVLAESVEDVVAHDNHGIANGVLVQHLARANQPDLRVALGI
jgi:hypothetical protein